MYFPYFIIHRAAVRIKLIQRRRNSILHPLCVESGEKKKNNTKQLTYETERDSQTENLMVVRGQGGGKDGAEGIIREFGLDTYTLLYLRWITDRDLPCSTGNSAQCSMPAWKGGESGEESVQFSRSVVSDSLRPHGLRHTRLPSPESSPRPHGEEWIRVYVWLSPFAVHLKLSQHY